jgi:hypothetical protein
MSFVANMLLGTLPKATPPKAPRRPRAKSKNHKTTQKALARYREVMGNEWVKTWEIARRLDTIPQVPQKALTRWLKEGLIERRKADKGYKWRML